MRDDPEALARVEHALRETSQLLRSTMTELNPAVLEQAGLPAALRSLVGSTGTRAGLATAVEVRGWPRDEPDVGGRASSSRRRASCSRTWSSTRRRRRVDVSLTLADGVARLVVADDGVGLDPEQAARRVGEGHIGLASRRVRLESEGGGLRLESGDRGGTSAVAELPLREA